MTNIISQDRINELDNLFWAVSNDNEAQSWRDTLTADEAAFIGAWEPIKISRDNILRAIEAKIIEHGFKYEYTDAYDTFPRIRQTDDDYIHVELRKDVRRHTVNIAASAYLRCASLTSSSPDDLRFASDQIRRAADLVDAINGMDLKCEPFSSLPLRTLDWMESEAQSND